MKKKQICGSAPCEQSEPSTIKIGRYWSGLKAADSIMAAFRKRNAQLLQPHNLRHGFTLAEILITLSIIGVVAALTIPALIQRTGNEEYVSRLLKTYSTLSQAAEAIMTENGGVKTWAQDVDSIYSLYKKHLRNSKECGSKTGCFTQGKYKFLNGYNETYSWDADTSRKRLILSDGTQLLFAYLSNECNENYAGSTNVCSAVWVDINGNKSPNVYGRDVFGFGIKESGIYPLGCDTEDITSVCNIDNNGYGCACRVIQEGAMNY